MRPIKPLSPSEAGSLGPTLEKWKQGMRVAGHDRTTDGQFVGLLAHRPELLQSVLNHYTTFLLSGTVPVRLKELLRIATADAIGCSKYCTNIRLESGREAGVSEEDICKARALADSDLAAEEKAALRFARAFVSTPTQLESHFAELKRHFRDEQIVEIGIACATFLGFGNMVVAFGLVAGAEQESVDPSAQEMNTNAVA